jgi:hypothetical protein
MDYENYFKEQSTAFPIYKGVRYQRGNGLGNLFKRFFRWIIPIVKEHAVPVLKDVGKKVGESVLTGTTNFAKDALEGKDIKDSAKNRFEQTTQDLKSKFSLKGKGINNHKRKKKLIKSISRTKKRKLDIFD